MVNSATSEHDKYITEPTDCLELITFTLGDKGEARAPTLYGLNVFKARELIVLPTLVETPNRHECCPGIANVRGKAIPVIDLQKYFGYPSESKQNILIITEFNGSTQGFTINEVAEIIQLDWGTIEEPPAIVTELTGVNHGNTLNGISILSDDSLLLIVDVEEIISEVLGASIDSIEDAMMSTRNRDHTVLFVDDSRVAREQITAILSRMELNYHCAENGQQALEILDRLADSAESAGQRLADSLSAIITDVEMPIIDGYKLTREIKNDRRFDGIPVMMHSSLSTEENVRQSEIAGVDVYVSKFQPQVFSEALDKIIDKSSARLSVATG